jgi:hypothetical protein
MISSSQLADFLSLIAPGFIAIEVFRSEYPIKTRNDKSNLYLYVVYSLIAGVLLALAYRLPSSLLFGHGIPSKGSVFYPFVLLAVGLLVGHACIQWYRLRFWLSKRAAIFKNLRPDPQTTWNRLNSDLKDRWAIVFLRDGSVYMGLIKYWNFDPDARSQDFFLECASRVDESLDIYEKPKAWKERYSVSCGVYIDTSEVSRIELHGESP